MFLEYNIGKRSSPDYVGWGAKTSLFHLTTLLATGFWDSGSDDNAVIDRYKIAMDVLRYREQGPNGTIPRSASTTVASVTSGARLRRRPVRRLRYLGYHLEARPGHR